MKRFKCNLEKVLDYRKIEEDIAQERYIESRNKAWKMEEQLDELNILHLNLYNFLRNEDTLNLDERIHARDYLYQHRKKIEDFQGRLSQQEKDVEEKQLEFVDKRKERRILENLKDKKYTRYYKDLLHTEQKELDEIAQRNRN
jgi:flagellar protein FliJ